MHFIEVNGVGLRYELSGSGERTVVLIHEMGGSLESWDEVAPVLAAGRRVLRYDTRGAGLSEKVRGALSIDTMVDDLAALLDALGITGKVALAGVAVGGAIALHAAARLPQRISRRRRRQPRHRHRARPARGGAGPRRAHRARGHAHRRRGLDGQRLSARVARRRGALCRLPRPLARQRSRELRRHLPHAGGHGPAGRSLPASPARCWCSAAASTASARRRWSSRWPARSPARATRCWRPATTWPWRRRSCWPTPSPSSSTRSAPDSAGASLSIPASRSAI